MVKRFLQCVFLLFVITPAVTFCNGSRENLDDLAARYGFPPPIQGRSNITFDSGCSAVAFEMGGRKLTFNGVLIWLNDPLDGTGRVWSVNRNDVSRILNPLLRSDGMLTTTRSPVVIIDAGHGGTDTGATGCGVTEKKATLDIARRVRDDLEGCNIHVHLTRDKDAPLPLEGRSTMAKKMNATLFLSIHMNSAESTNASGLETYVMPAPGFASTSGGNGHSLLEPGNRFDGCNLLLAYQIHRSVLARTGALDRGIKHARYEVLAQAPCPAALIECGFVSNTYDAAMLLTTSYRQLLADGIAQGIMEYLRGGECDPKGI